MAETDIGQWYSNIPFFTKWWFTLTLICTLGANFGVLPVMHMLLDWNFVVYKFQVSRHRIFSFLGKQKSHAIKSM